MNARNRCLKGWNCKRARKTTFTCAFTAGMGIRNADDLKGIDIEGGKLHISSIKKDTPEEALDFSASLYDLFTRMKLTKLLIETASWTKFHEQFIHASVNRPPNTEETKVLMAAYSDSIRVLPQVRETEQ